MDQPFSLEEIVKMSRERICPVGRAHAWYKEFENAKKTGNCNICGWGDGDGIKTCFYSSEIGAVIHQNSDAGAEKSMTPEQVSLFRLRSAMCYIDENARALHFAEVRYHAAFEKSRVSKAFPDQIFRKKSDGTEWSDEDFHTQYEEREKNKTPLATSLPYAGWIKNEWWIPVEYPSTGYEIPAKLRYRVKTCGKTLMTTYYVHCNEPHSCGGTKKSIGPYHYQCDTCGVEIREWEHGIDYDCG